MYKNLPAALISKIYTYDPTYKLIFNYVLLELELNFYHKCMINKLLATLSSDKITLLFFIQNGINDILHGGAPPNP